MENPSLTITPNHVVTPGGGGTGFAGESGRCATGRPSDIVSFDGMQVSNERAGSPVANDLLPVNKKGRRFSDPVNVPDSSELQGMMETESGEGEVQIVQQKDSGCDVSFKDKLLGTKRSDEGKLPISELDVEVRAEDVRIGGSSELPEICCGIPEVVVDTIPKEVEQRKPEELYGPWMQVVNKRRRNSSNPSMSRAGERTTKQAERSGSRFAALAEEHDSIIEVGEDPVRNAATDTAALNQRGRLRLTREKSEVAALGNNERLGSLPNQLEVGCDGEQSCNSIKPVEDIPVTESEQSPKSNGQLEELSVAAKGKVVAASSTLPNDKHRAVVVIDGDGGLINTGAKGRVLPASIRGSQAKVGNKLKLGSQSGNNLKLGTQSGGMKETKARKNGGARQRNTIADRLSPLVREMDDAVLTETMRLNQVRNDSNMENMNLQWRPNLVFEQPGDTDMQV
ncbi:hypothetical protein V6N13_040153 [Hibiscus sabdariffa]